MFEKVVKNHRMSTFGVKTKVVRTEILNVLMGPRARGDLYLTISRPSRIFPISSQFSQIWPGGRASGLEPQGRGSNPPPAPI